MSQKVKIFNFFIADEEASTSLTLEHWKNDLSKYEECMISQEQKILFEDWYEKKLLSKKNTHYQAWLMFKQASL